MKEKKRKPAENVNAAESPSRMPLSEDYKGGAGGGQTKKCPGMDSSNWKFSDIVTRACPQCSHEMEFWKDDVKLRCPSCGRESFNPNLDNTCLSWCDQAAACICDMSIQEWKRLKASSHAGK